jgi:hypothetical protein
LSSLSQYPPLPRYRRALPYYTWYRSDAQAPIIAVSGQTCKLLGGFCPLAGD